MAQNPEQKTSLFKPESRETTPITYKGEKFNPKLHGWRTWGSNPYLILQDSSKEQRDAINKDMVKEFNDWKAARPYLYPRKNNGDKKDESEETKKSKDESEEPKDKKDESEESTLKNDESEESKLKKDESEETKDSKDESEEPKDKKDESEEPKDQKKVLKENQEVPSSSNQPRNKSEKSMDHIEVINTHQSREGSKPFVTQEVVLEDRDARFEARTPSNQPGTPSNTPQPPNK